MGANKQFQSKLMQMLSERGFLYQCTDETALDEQAHKAPICGYIGFDCTAPNLHVGSLVQIMMLRIIQKCGGQPIVLLGGGTTKIGDPSDKDKSRPILTPEEIERNKAGIKQVFESFLDFEGENPAILIDNAQWLDGLGYIDVLRTIGKHFTVNRMVQMDTVRRRLENEQPMTFLEFNYPILQAYDFYELNKRYKCTLQCGGSDQWGNIVNGIDLTRRLNNAEVYGFTSPLITTSSGVKMGKTAQGAVWLGAKETRFELTEAYSLSAYEYWQFWRSCEDTDTGRFLRLFTDLEIVEIEKLESLSGAAANEAKIVLANAATNLLHGAKKAREAEQTAFAAFTNQNTGLEGLDMTVFAKADLDMLSFTDAGVLSGLCTSKGEARRHVKQGALRINDEIVLDSEQKLNQTYLNAEGLVKVSIGKKRHAVLKAE